ncbi:hypothetical protein GGD66_006934 [Bradyrhizobium sp. CIR48]|uniref:hypothetical protein n=1 Tax=Bradyrhizobium sp. CIR48 TaxID=2663840 RepID=UPI00160666A5|nr:hypothetical protein [Bradyrhizobium sp. CIR48]MBB4428347.1 hypothetical protein [Bradyrhizobium sp. CIR48]
MGHSYIPLNGLIGRPSPGRAAARKCALRQGTKVRAGLPDQLSGEKEIGIALESAVQHQFM